MSFHRSLIEYRTRKAHRWIIREKDLLRYFTIIFITVLFYLLSSIQYNCRLNSWFHIVTETSSLLLLLFIIYQNLSLRKCSLQLFPFKYYYLLITIVQLLFELVYFVLLLINVNYIVLFWFNFVRIFLPGILLLVLFIRKFIVAFREERIERGMTISGKQGGQQRKQQKIYLNTTENLLVENINLDEMDISEIRVSPFFISFIFPCSHKR